MLILGMCALQPKPVVDVHLEILDVGPHMSFVKLRYTSLVLYTSWFKSFFDMVLLKVSALFHEVPSN
jgi:hypothetical protein